MKLSLFVTITALIAALDVINAVPSCRREISSYTLQNLRCAEHGIEVQGLAGKLAQGDITYERLAEIVAAKCEAANTAKCYDDISKPIEGSCNEAESVQHFRNAFKTVLTFNEYMCQNNGQKYLDFVKNSGAECYYNEEKANCYAERKLNARISDKSFTDENVCVVLEADWECLNYYDECENQNVRLFYQQVLMSLREKFSC